MAEYKNIPIDLETHDMLMALCDAYEFGKRGQGAMVRKLVKAEHEKLAAVKLIPTRKPKGEKADSHAKS